MSVVLGFFSFSLIIVIMLKTTFCHVSQINVKGKRRKSTEQLSYARIIDENNVPNRPAVICFQVQTLQDKLGKPPQTVDISNTQKL
ncbi:hypothetical protein EDC96DRAFT_532614 [Choanephora cucurbitarum]|nr:hypothetical protein EDC96DRAFT_532614 [Choanephora cucurbitarum]